VLILIQSFFAACVQRMKPTLAPGFPLQSFAQHVFLLILRWCKQTLFFETGFNVAGKRIFAAIPGRCQRSKKF